MTFTDPKLYPFGVDLDPSARAALLTGVSESEKLAALPYCGADAPATDPAAVPGWDRASRLYALYSETESESERRRDAAHAARMTAERMRAEALAAFSAPTIELSDGRII